MSKSSRAELLGSQVLRFLAEMHRYDAGRSLPILHASNLTTPQLAVLDFVRTPCTVSAVAAHVQLSRPATSQMVDKLVRLGLVHRDLAADDRRERRVTLAPKGEALLERIAAARAARFQASLAILPASLARRFSEVLDEVVDVLARGGARAGSGTGASASAR